MSEFTRKYDYVDGAKIRLNLKGRQIPVPPEWVRLRSNVPKRGQHACLSKEIADLYPDQVRETMVKYVSEWPDVRKSGTDLIIAGRVPSRRLRWAASAVVNEIVMRYGAVSAITTEWFSPGNLSWLLDARSSKADEYGPIRNRILGRKLLFIENPLAIDNGSEGMWFLRALYQHRYDNQLPTITTLSTDVSEGWETVRRGLGPDITDILRDNNHGFIAHY